jgi:hypothetical protein
MTLRRTRVGTTPDMVRISSAVQRPGIDPRVWCSLGYARAESVLDAKHGDFVDVTLLPSELEVTCRIPQGYAGKDFGSNKGRIHKDDEVVVLFPDGDPATGGVIVARLWSASDVPPQLAIDNPKDVVEVVEKDTNLRGKVSGSGVVDLSMEADLSIKAPTDTVVKLNKDGLELGVSPSDFVALASLVKAEISAVRSSLAAFITLYNTHMHATAAPGPPIVTTNLATPPAPVGEVKSAFTKSK